MEPLMYQQTFGTKGQVRCDTPKDYYEFLGFLSRNDGTTRIVWEHNDEQGAWAEEGRIQFYIPHPTQLRAKLLHTAGTGSVVTRVNCNEFIEHITTHHGFTPDGAQNQVAILASIPSPHRVDFDRGLAL